MDSPGTIAPLARGRVKWFDVKKGFVFIVDTQGAQDRDVFVHFTTIEGMGFRALRCGEQVEFAVKEDPKGLSSSRVRRIDIEGG